MEKNENLKDMIDDVRKIPAVDKLLQEEAIIKLIGNYGRELVVYAIRNILDKIRKELVKNDEPASFDGITHDVIESVENIAGSSLKPVINATGIILHTNLGRAPLGDHIQKAISPILTGYSNLEFDLKKGKRGQRNSHISELLNYITNGEASVVVNNNAAAVMLCLKTFAAGKEVIISRGELIEIGGSFRIPEIMAASGAQMVEVGSTNRTRLADYEKAITSETRIIFKAHKSNYFIGGFSEEAEIEDLVGLARKHNLIFIYDLGSGLLRKPENLPLVNEPDVKSCIESGADIITFSGDKLLGGPQAGIIIGKKELVSQLAHHPQMRALRVGKMTLAALHGAISCYLDDAKLVENIPLFKLLSRKETELKVLAKRLSNEFTIRKVDSEIIKSVAYCGGGTLPQLKINSYAVKLIIPTKEKYFAERIFYRLLKSEKPVLGILREGKLLFDVLSIFEKEIPLLAERVSNAIAG